MNYAAIYAVVVGLGIIGQWSASYVTKQIPELKDEPIRIWFHIAGEMITAVCLITAGAGLLMSKYWGRQLFPVAMGMLFYTMIVSTGYFGQKGDWKWLGIFGTLIALGLVSLVVVI